MNPRTAASLLLVSLVVPSIAAAQQVTAYKVLATNKTSSMQKEMQEAAEAGYRFAAVMGGETSFGGKEVVVLMQKLSTAKGRFEYRLLATSKTSTMQKELQEAADAGFEYIGQTVFKSLFGGKEVGRHPRARSVDRASDSATNTSWSRRRRPRRCRKSCRKWASRAFRRSA